MRTSSTCGRSTSIGIGWKSCHLRYEQANHASRYTYPWPQPSHVPDRFVDSARTHQNPPSAVTLHGVTIGPYLIHPEHSPPRFPTTSDAASPMSLGHLVAGKKMGLELAATGWYRHYGMLPGRFLSNAESSRRCGILTARSPSSWAGVAQANVSPSSHFLQKDLRSGSVLCHDLPERDHLSLRN